MTYTGHGFRSSSVSVTVTSSRDCSTVRLAMKKALDFAYNASLAAVNITKVLRMQTKMPFSIGQIKSLMVNAHFIKRFFDLSGIDPNKTLNAKLVKELFGLAVDAA